ncbi:hypothetical protein FRB91_000128 [Serendipita sp. 411]|nr:hypothetical protein FRB91_000128 [Serendipita sp. 411]
MNNEIHGSSSTGLYLPIEVWYIILDFAIDAPNFFCTTYDGRTWTADVISKLSSFSAFPEYRRSEDVRKAIGCVCRSWRRFSVSRRHRYVDPYSLVQLKPAALDLNVISHAQCASMSSITTQGHVSRLTQGVEWEVAFLKVPHLEQLALLPHPRLRRIKLSISGRRVLNLTSLLNALESYKDLTWLTLDLDNWSRWIPFPRIGREPVVLRNLEVFFFSCPVAHAVSAFHLNLPKLRHFRFRCDTSPEVMSLEDVISPYSKTIRSIAITTNEGRPLDREFPPWTDYPMLEELALDSALVIEFHPLPRTHPLRRLHAPQWRKENIENWLESDNLERVQLLNASWNYGGSLMNANRASEMEPISKHDMDMLLARAKERGIQVDIGGDWQS